MVIGNSKGEGGVKGQNFFREGMKLNWNFQRGGGIKTKRPSLGGVWTPPGQTHRKIEEEIEQKNALYLGVNVFSMKVLIGDTILTSPAGDGTAILRGHPSHAKV